MREIFFKNVLECLNDKINKFLGDLLYLLEIDIQKFFANTSVYGIHNVLKSKFHKDPNKECEKCEGKRHFTII